MSDALIRRRVIVRGLVQGVFFRETTRRQAVETLIDFCRVGPRGAYVDGVEVRDEPPEGLTGFAVR